MGRQTKEETKIKIKILDKYVIELKEKSTPIKNLLTLNNLLELTNEECIIRGLTTISPSSIKGKDKSKAYEKYSEIVKDFENTNNKNKDLVSNSNIKKIKNLESQVENLILELVYYQDKYNELEKEYENQKILLNKYRYERDEYLNR